MTDPQGTRLRGPNCWQCRFFAVSWDPRMPYACQRFGFKTPMLPAIEVLRTDGQPCRGFSPKGAAASAPEPSGGGSAKTQVPSKPRGASGLWEA